jgi:hypothetical protein
VTKSIKFKIEKQIEKNQWNPKLHLWVEGEKINKIERERKREKWEYKLPVLGMTGVMLLQT